MFMRCAYDQCKMMFETKTKTKKYCSVKCREAAREQRKKAREAAKEQREATERAEAIAQAIKDRNWCWCEPYDELLRASHCRRRRKGLLPMAPWIRKYCHTCNGSVLRRATDSEIEAHKNDRDQGDRARGKKAGV